MNQEQRDRLAGIAERMRAVGRMWFVEFAREIETCIAEPVDAQPAPTVEAHP